ncbi:response regulator [Fulvimarina manganoxydans]|uniref:response regulator n=1 Tax=Fulvimarina manganoxydans TaxID=937218 RepID=UPI002357C678|nr:response regulator [Fulvimarina manganoxydans]
MKPPSLESSKERFDGLRVFIVEDESLIAMQLEDMLLDLDCEVLGPAMRLKSAQRMMDEGLEADVAILDVNLGGETVFPLAERLRDGQTPIVFATGYGRQGVPEEWHVYPILQKPYTTQQIEEAMRRVVWPVA